MANGQGHLVLRHVRAILAAHDADQLSDRQLLSRFHGQNDQAAFTALVRRHGPMVLAVCRRVLPNAHDADDAFQAAFFTLARRAGAGTWHESLGPWLHLVAHRLALRIQAETQRRSRHESQATSRSPDDPLATITGRELCAVIDAELSALPERLRAPLVLCCLEGKTRDEASRHLGWSLSTLKRRLDQGRERLRLQLQRRGFALPGALAGLLAIEETQAARPAALIHQTVVLASAGTSASARVALLSEEILKSTLLAKGKSLACVLLAVCAALAGTGLIWTSFPVSPAVEPPSQVKAAAPQEQKQQPAAGSAQAPVDLYGDPLPGDAVARLGTLRLYGGQEVQRVVLSPDAKLVVSVTREGNRLWDAVTGRELPLKQDLKMGLIFTAQGKLLAVEKREMNELICHDLAGGGMVRLPPDTPEIKRARTERSWQKDIVSPDGSMRAIARKKRIHLYNVRSGKELQPFADQVDEMLASLTFSPDGKLLASSHPSGVRLWDISKRKLIRHCRAKDSEVCQVIFSADGKTLAGADGSSVTLWDVATGKWRHEFHHTYLVGALAFTPDGMTLLSGSAYNDPIIRLWDPLTGREKGQWHGHTVDVQTLAICPDGKIAVSGGQDRTLRLWDVAAGKELRRLGGAKEMIWSAAFSPDGRMLASASKAVRLWDVGTGQELRSFGGGTILQVGFSRDGKAVASVAPGEKTVRLWDVATGRELRQFANHMQHGPHFAFSPDGRTLATGDSAGPLHVWELATGEEIRTIGAPMKPDPRAAWALQPVAFSPDGRTLAAGYSDETVRLWEVASGQERARFHGHRNGVVSLAFSPDGSLLASGSWDRTVMIWDVKGQITARRPPSKLEITKLKVLWDDLGSADASKAYRAFQTLLGAPREVLPLLKQHLHPVAAADAKLVTRLVADLDSDQFDVREKATRGLRDMADLAELPLRTALAGAASPELRRRAETLLEDMGLGRSPTLLQNFRAIEVLEHIATPEARQLLQKLAGGAVEARLTREAKAACDRLAARR